MFRYPEAFPSSYLHYEQSNPSLFEALLKLHREYQSLTPDQLARLFKKSKHLRNSLEVMIEDLKFISYPISCSEMEDANKDVITQFNIILIMLRKQALQRILSRHFLHISSIQNPNDICYQNIHQLTSISETHMSKILELFSMSLYYEERRVNYVSEQVQLMMIEHEEKSEDSKIIKEEVLIPSIKHLSISSKDRSSFSSRERSESNVVRMEVTSPQTTTLTTRERSNTKDSVVAAPVNLASSESSANHPGPSSETQVAFGETSANAMSVSLLLTKKKLRVSTLANELRLLYHQLVGMLLLFKSNKLFIMTIDGRQVHIRLNSRRGGILVHHDLTQLHSPSHMTSLVDHSPLFPYPFVHPLPPAFDCKQPSDIRPYHTLIPLIEVSKMQDDDLSWISPFPTRTILELIRALDPRISLEEIASTIEQPIDQVCTSLITRNIMYLYTLNFTSYIGPGNFNIFMQSSHCQSDESYFADFHISY